ncbi:MAG: lipocalin family protein [Gordonia sp. (in: high G+C Gram-positive bacteria)]
MDNRCMSFTGAPDGIVGRADLVDAATKAQFSVSFPGIPFTIDPQKRPNYTVAWVQDGATATAPYRDARSAWCAEVAAHHLLAPRELPDPVDLAEHLERGDRARAAGRAAERVTGLSQR